MEQATGNNPNPTQQKWLLAKMMLLKFGVLSDFHIKQIEAYTYACSKLVSSGEFEIDADNKKVTYHLKTSHNFYQKGDDFVLRSKYSLIKLKTILLYKKEIKKASKILNQWTDKLLWEGSTKVEVYIDNVRV